MPEHEIAGGEVWLHADERVVSTIDIQAGSLLGIVTTRESGRFYASLVRLGNRTGSRFDVPQWEFTALKRCICASLEEAREVVLDVAASLTQHGA